MEATRNYDIPSEEMPPTPAGRYVFCHAEFPYSQFFS